MLHLAYNVSYSVKVEQSNCRAVRVCWQTWILSRSVGYIRILPEYLPVNLNFLLTLLEKKKSRKMTERSGKPFLFEQGWHWLCVSINSMPLSWVQQQGKIIPITRLCGLEGGYRQGRRLRVASGATAPGPALEGARASGLWICQAIFSGKLEMLIHAPFKILLQGQIP